MLRTPKSRRTLARLIFPINPPSGVESADAVTWAPASGPTERTVCLPMPVLPTFPWTPPPPEVLDAILMRYLLYSWRETFLYNAEHYDRTNELQNSSNNTQTRKAHGFKFSKRKLSLTRQDKMLRLREERKPYRHVSPPRVFS